MNLIKQLYGQKDSGRNILLYSGGTDSTLLLYELTQAYPDQIVWTVSIKAPWLDQKKYESELEVRRKFISHLLNKGRLIRHQEVCVSHNLIEEMQPVAKTEADMLQAECGGCPQAVYWLASLLIYLKSGDYFYYGLLGIDDNASSIENYKYGMNYFLATLDRTNIDLRTPLIHKTKDYVLSKLLAYDIYDYTWHCEMPREKNIPCYKCQPCMNHLKALAGIAEFHKDEEIRNKARKLIDEAHEKMK